MEVTFAEENTEKLTTESAFISRRQKRFPNSSTTPSITLSNVSISLNRTDTTENATKYSIMLSGNENLSTDVKNQIAEPTGIPPKNSTTLSNDGFVIDATTAPENVSQYKVRSLCTDLFKKIAQRLRIQYK